MYGKAGERKQRKSIHLTKNDVYSTKQAQNTVKNDTPYGLRIFLF